MRRGGLAGRVGTLCAALALGAVALLSWAAPASADLEFCPPGEGAEQCGLPENLSSQRGLALDYESGRLYVADQANNRVNVFKEDGTFLFAFGWGVDTEAAKLETCTTASGCEAGLAGSGPGQLDKPTKVAVDNDPASPSFHDVYVVDPSNSRVQKFDPTGAPGTPVEFVWTVGAPGEAEGQFKSDISADVGPGGVLYVLDDVAAGHRLQRFKPSGEPIPPQCILFQGGSARDIAVDSSGNSWVANEGQGEAIRKFDPSCALLFPPIDSDVENVELALDEAGNLFAVQGEGPFWVITAHNPAGEILSRFAYGRIPPSFKPEGLAVHNGGAGGIFVAVRGVSAIRRLDFPPPPPTLPSPGPIAAPPSLEAVGVGSAKATLVGKVNPEGKATSVHFEYLTQADYEAQGNSFAGPATKKTPTTALSIPAGREFKLNATEALAGCPDPAAEAGEPASKCLTPATIYRWRVVATNADNPTGEGEGTVEGPSFKTKPSPEFGEIYATRVGTDTARLNGEVNPNSIPATGYFEYVDDASYEAGIKAAEEEGKSRQEAEEEGRGFAAATKAPDEGKGQAPLDFGAGEALATRGVAIFPLEPGTVYHYRLVADNPLVEPVIGEEVKELRTFEPPETPPCPGNEASRIGPGAFLPDCRAYEMVSPIDKAGGAILVLKNSQELTVLEQSSTSGEKLAYGSVRSFGGAASGPVTSQYIARRIAGKEWQTHPINSPRERPTAPAPAQFNAEFKAFSADLCDTWVTTLAEPPLAPGALAGVSNLYRRTDELCSEDGAAHYEALAPIEEPLGVPADVGLTLALLGVSADGGHAVFVTNGELAEEGAGKGTQQLYESVGGAPPRLACILPGGKPESGGCTAGSGTLGADPNGAISDDGERVFWSAPGKGIYVRSAGTQTVAVSTAEKAWFWGAAADGSVAIFSSGFLSQGKATLHSFELEGEVDTPIAAGVRGVMGMSEDARRVYFASDQALPGSEENSEGDEAKEGEPNLYLYEAGEGGGSTQFIATLASGDLTPAVSNERFNERNSRVSPDGAHAAFVSEAPLTGYDNKGAASGVATKEIYRYDAAANELACVSCNPSGARPAGPSAIPPLETDMHGARVLSDDGSRLYFESADALVARDTNGRVDIYQWEESGAGGCDAQDAGFSASAGGCVELVSSGQSPQDSRFVEASPTGDDVFFVTGASLLPQDPGVLDIYDARVGGGLPIPPPSPPPCEGDACHAQIPAPQEPTPASSDYAAPTGPPAKGKPKHCAKGKRRVSKKGKSRCVPKRQNRRHHGRASR